MARSVSHFTRQRRIVALCIAEALEGRHLHVIGVDGIMGLIAAPDAGPVAAKNASAEALRCTASSRDSASS